MFFSRVLVAASLVAVAAANSCVNLTIPITISARNGVFNNYGVPESNLDATTLAQALSRQGHNATAEALTAYATVSGSYNISAAFCTPSSGQSTVLQILTHGIGFDKSYWNLNYNNFNYSYVNAALGAGYSVFFYDRLGIGMSSHGEPRNEIQAPLEVSALIALTNMLRGGSISGISQKFSKVVHVGHSFGSQQSFMLSALAPNISDALVLTGYSANSSFNGLFISGANFGQAMLNQPYRLGNKATAEGIANALVTSGKVDPNIINGYDLTDFYAQPLPGTQPLNYPAGYLASKDVGSLQYLFLQPGNYDLGIAYAGESTKQPVTIGELLTEGSASSTTFTGPVLVFTGQSDLPFCGGDCFATGSAAASIPAEAKKLFPSAKSFTAYIQPNTGHGLNMHYNATAGYQYIFSWLKSQGM